ncbi:modA: molybdate ABC transporter/periplasmic molybdate-binding protein [Gaiella occulta]|uniref:ModA: molybdate ABC transporter/periplasmic molybdate-binding protein n=1 Tax=Gaiella occulta TaxID=1002870 RepID=A0A7M2YYF5_9ACTN|nr:molybdate ABC transporter substrate-binding protein [Gaiella occulta]RDI74770.1 modA: molybdate ABC transporter/periplasmic molybdate-binding protein [Gaiella occulta]
MKRALPAVAIAVPAACAAVSVSLAATAAPAGGPPVVLAAASLTEVLPRIEANARYSFGGSGQLAQQIRQGAPADLFLSASPRYTQELFAAGLVRKPVAFATNRLVLIVPKRNPAGIRSVGDLERRRGLRLVVAGAKVPIGLYTREVLERLGLLRVLRKAVSLEPDVKGVVTKVALGEADAGFVYATDVRPVAAKVVSIPLPRRAQPTVRYEVAITSSSRHVAAAQDLVIALLGPDGRRQLRSAGFGIP